MRITFTSSITLLTLDKDNTMLFGILVITLLSVSLSSFYFFMAGLSFWLVIAMVLPGTLLTAVVIGSAEK